MRYNSFLLTLSQTLRASVRVKVENKRPLIYEWDFTNGVGTQVLVSENAFSELAADHLITKREGKSTFLLFYFEHENVLLKEREFRTETDGYYGCFGSGYIVLYTR